MTIKKVEIHKMEDKTIQNKALRVSIIIPTLNEEENIGNLLDSIERQSLTPFEVIVVDGNSEDNTKEEVLKRDVKLLSSGRGVGRQRNTGGLAAQGNILVFLDADTVFEPGFLSESVEEFVERDLDVACPVFVPSPRFFLANFLFGFANFFFRKTEKVQGNGAGPCIFIKKPLFENILFSEELNFEDVILIRKASEIGKYRILNKKIVVSSRRMREEGVFLVFKYFFASIFFMFGKFEQAHKVVKYKFNIYK